MRSTIDTRPLDLGRISMADKRECEAAKPRMTYYKIWKYCAARMGDSRAHYVRNMIRQLVKETHEETQVR